MEKNLLLSFLSILIGAHIYLAFRSTDGMHTGIEYKGDGMFLAFVASPTTNYEYKVVYFYTD